MPLRIVLLLHRESIFASPTRASLLHANPIAFSAVFPPFSSMNIVFARASVVASQIPPSILGI